MLKFALAAQIITDSSTEGSVKNCLGVLGALRGGYVFAVSGRDLSRSFGMTANMELLEYIFDRD